MKSERTKQPVEYSWMATARRLEAEHREQAAQRMREDHLSSPDCSEWYRERDREEGMDYWRSRIASGVNLYRKRPQMDDMREGMNDSERAAYDKGVLDALQLATGVTGSFRSPVRDVTLAVAGINNAIWDIVSGLQKRYGRDQVLDPPAGEANEQP